MPMSCFPLPQAPCPFSYKPGPGSQGTGSWAPIPALGRAGEQQGISPVQLAQEYVCTEYMDGPRPLRNGQCYTGPPPPPPPATSTH